MNDENRKNGEPTVKPAEVSKQLSAEWNKLSNIEKAAAVDEYIEEFEAQRDEATVSVQNVGLKAFHDIRAQADALHARTSVEVVFTVVCTDFGQYNKPYTWATSSRADDFFNHVYKSDPTQTALRLESYMLSGIGGVTQNYIQSFTELKSATAKLIHDKLNEAVGHPVSGMKYTNFHKYITTPHRLVIKGWPLSKFASPSDIGSKSDCEVLRAAWTSGTCRFEKLDDAKYLKLCAAMSTSSDDPEPRDQAADDHADHIDPPTTSPSLSHNATTSITDSPNTLPSIHTTPSTPLPVPLPTNPTVVTNAPTPASMQSLKRPADPFVAIIGLNGNIINVAKKPRKTRSDKGMPRSPRKKVSAPTPLPSASTAPASPPSPSSPSLSTAPSPPPANPTSFPSTPSHP
ncbi:hypothetical protein FA13DRAFT_1704653 [Coprinellus micaceus]|uniref:Uncharacterized protein n=1 Tax=Coprinellus micaceus TaxID=71717 RepID=A0A4Y7TYK3_COPMI|nr:hypothetical protein FA13DRAFT_1704653 [Coprinellus micaceus]